MERFMRSFALLAVVSILVAACSDGGVNPTSPEHTPAISADVVAASSSGAGCDNWSPCDGWPNYAQADGGIQSGRPASSVIGTGNPGTFFLPELVDNHKPFPGAFIPGLTDFLSAVVCEGDRGIPPDLATCTEPKNAASAFTQEGDSYKAAWKPSKAGDDERTWRIFVTLSGVQVLAHRDVYVGDPSSVNPADGEVLSVRANSNVNIKVAITDASGLQVGNCTAADNNVQTEPPEEITCIIPAGTQGSISMITTGGTVVANFGEQFPLLIDVDAACDDIDTDLKLFGPCVDMEAPTLNQALQNSKIFFCDENDDPLGGAPAGAFVLQQSTAAGAAGTQALPAIDCTDQLASASIRDGFFGFITEGVEKVAGLMGARELVATSAVGHSGGGGGLRGFGSRFQLAYGAYLDQPELPEVVQEDETVDVEVPVVGAEGTTVYLFSTYDGAALGDVSCPQANPQPDGGTCDDDTGLQYDPVVFTTGSGSAAKAVWTPGPAGSGAGGKLVELRALGAGIGVGGSDAVDAGDGIEGTLIPFDRDPFGTDGANNGPIANVVDAFEPWPHELSNGGKPVALNDLAQISTVLVCGGDVAPQDIDGLVDDEWACAGDPKLAFIANLSGKKPTAPNAFLYAMDDGTDVYFGLKVDGAKGIADVFISFSQVGQDGSADEGDDLILLREDGTKADMYSTDGCVSSQGKTLCGVDDPAPGDVLEADADDNGDFDFYEFKKPRCSNETDGSLSVDFCLDINNDDLWAYITFTGGKGGGQGSTIAEGFREWTLIFGDGQ